MTLGSLFDGIGGFPLAAVHSGITPLWASEIEAFPIEVTKLRFPDMLHVGDITKLDGAKLPPVDIICGGSPCQDLSVAGQRRGLAGSRSGLFMEQVRIVKEMRNAEIRNGRTAQFVRPRFLLWENVPGAFSSGTPKGEDFRIVLEEIIRIKDSSCSVPRPDSGAWGPAGRPYWEMNSAWLGDVWTRGSGVSPREERESSLSQILQLSPHPEYYLSPKACLGILRRAKERGKELPEKLKDALMAQSGLSSVPVANSGLKAYHINQRDEGIDLGEVSGTLMATINRDPAQAKRSGLRGERRSSGMSELSSLGESEGYGACDDAQMQTFIADGCLTL